jgi:hypothetical protein
VPTRNGCAPSSTPSSRPALAPRPRGHTHPRRHGYHRTALPQIRGLPRGVTTPAPAARVTRRGRRRQRSPRPGGTPGPPQRPLRRPAGTQAPTRACQTSTTQPAQPSRKEQASNGHHRYLQQPARPGTSPRVVHEIAGGTPRLLSVDPASPRAFRRKGQDAGGRLAGYCRRVAAILPSLLTLWSYNTASGLKVFTNLVDPDGGHRGHPVPGLRLRPADLPGAAAPAAAPLAARP